MDFLKLNTHLQFAALSGYVLNMEEKIKLTLA